DRRGRSTRPRNPSRKQRQNCLRRKSALGTPERRVELAFAFACRLAFADDVASCVDGDGLAVGAADGAEVDHPALPRPGEGMEADAAGGSAVAGHLAAWAHVDGDAEGAAEGAEVDHPARLGPREGVSDSGGGSAPADDLTAVAGGDGSAD